MGSQRALKILDRAGATTGSSRPTKQSTAPDQHAPRHVIHAAANENVVADERQEHADTTAVRTGALLEQLLAVRTELVQTIVPRAERGVLGARDLDHVRVQVDAAVASARSIAANAGIMPARVVRQRDFWRSEEVPQ